MSRRWMVGLLVTAAGCPRPGAIPSGLRAEWLAAFTYRPERIPVGAVHEYVKSNRDGSLPIRVVVYLAARDRLEVLKLEPHVRAGAWVTAHLDWRIFSADRIDSWNLARDGTRRFQARGRLDAAEGRFRVNLRGRHDVLRVPRYPFHFYNFDLVSAGQLFRHLRDPRGAFTIGIVDPVFRRGSKHLVAFKGPLRIRYLRDAPCRRRTCRVYRMGGPGLLGRSGEIWVDRAEGHVVRIDSPVPDNPQWKNFRLELRSRRRLGREAWRRYVTESLRRL